jgi:hypothetical protein
LNGQEEPALLVTYPADEAMRSSALYRTIQHLSESGLVLRSVSQLQQTLENVFLQLTSTDKANN